MGKPFRPSSAFGEAIVLSPIAVDFVGGIIWGTSREPGGAQTPRGRDLEHQRPDLSSSSHQYHSRG
jgi:hypothetical protein